MATALALHKTAVAKLGSHKIAANVKASSKIAVKHSSSKMAAKKSSSKVSTKKPPKRPPRKPHPPSKNTPVTPWSGPGLTPWISF